MSIANFTDPFKTALGDVIVARVTHVSLHSADPGTTGLNEEARSATTLVNALGIVEISNVLLTGGAANAPAAFIGFWMSGAWQGHLPMPAAADDNFNGAGEYTIDLLRWNPLVNPAA